MKLVPVILLILTLAIGVYLQSQQTETKSAEQTVEDTVESSLAAPARAEIPL